MPTSDNFVAVRYYGQFDPYHYLTDNRPLQDMSQNDGVLATAIDVLNLQHSLATVGDANLTLTPKVSNGKTLFNTALTTNRTITLVNTNGWNGATFKVIRSANATGAFNLDVGGLKTLSAAGQWAEVTYNGTAWQLTGYGTL